MSRRPRFATLPALLVVLALAAPGCGADGAGPLTLDSFADAADRTREEGSSRVEIVTTMEMEMQEQSMQMSGEGVFDYAANRGTMTMTLPEADEVEMRVDGTVAYVRVPEGEETGLPEGVSWIRIDAAAHGAQAGQFGQIDQQNPGRMLDYLHAAEDEPEEVGREEVRGVETTHYRAQVNLEEMAEQELEQLPEEQREQQRQQLEQLREMLTEPTIPVEVWVDDDGLLRRMTMEMTLEAPGLEGQPTEMRMTMRMELFDYGVDVEVETPAEDEVVDYDELGQPDD